MRIGKGKKRTRERKEKKNRGEKRRREIVRKSEQKDGRQLPSFILPSSDLVLEKSER